MRRRLAATLAIAILVVGGCGRYGPPTAVDRTPVARAAPGGAEESPDEGHEATGSLSP